MAEKAYVAIRTRLILLDIRPNDPIERRHVAQELRHRPKPRCRKPFREAGSRSSGCHLLQARNLRDRCREHRRPRRHFQIRALLEPLAARRAAERAPRSTRADLDDLATRTETLRMSAHWTEPSSCAGT